MPLRSILAALSPSATGAENDAMETHHSLLMSERESSNRQKENHDGNAAELEKSKRKCSGEESAQVAKRSALSTISSQDGTKGDNVSCSRVSLSPPQHSELWKCPRNTTPHQRRVPSSTSSSRKQHCEEDGPRGRSFPSLPRYEY
jgi:hypothetical protein